MTGCGQSCSQEDESHRQAWDGMYRRGAFQSKIYLWPSRVGEGNGRGGRGRVTGIEDDKIGSRERGWASDR